MKNTLTPIVILLTSLLSYSQAETEVLGTWYLHYRTINGVTTFPPLTTEEDYTITLHFGLLPPSAGNPFTIESFGTTADSFDGRYTVDNGIMKLFNINEPTDNTCNYPTIVCDYYTDYTSEILFDPNTSSVPNEYLVDYLLNGSGNDEGLTITNNFRGDIAVYGRQALSIQENTLSRIKLLKNPANEFLLFNIGSEQEVVITIYNISGKPVKQQMLEAEIYIGNLSDGIYIIELSNSQKNKKILKLIKH